MSDRSAGGSVKWGVLGCGRVADRRIAPAISAADNAQLAAFCSRSLDRATEYMERHQAELAFDELGEMLDERQVDAVYVATPNAFHAEHVLACLEAGKHVLVDKPMATNSEDAGRMVDAAKRARRSLSVMFQMRHHPANQQLKEMIEEGSLGTLSLLRAHVGFWFPPAEGWRQDAELSGGGPVMDLAPHAIDLLRFLAGDVVEVQATTANVQFRYHVEDLGLATLRFASGPVGRLDVSYCSHDYGGRVEAFGSEATALVDGSLQQIGNYRVWYRRGKTDQAAQIVEGQFADCYVAAIEEFSDAVLQQRQPAITAADGLATVEVIEAIYESAESGRAVSLEA
jgi:predicted dehydrogenase